MTVNFLALQNRANKLTARDIIEAIRKNGYPQLTEGNYIHIEDDQIVAACAFGQAGLNLAPDYWSLEAKEAFIGYVHRRALNLNPVFRYVVPWNDSDELTLAEIANELDKAFGYAPKTDNLDTV